ncbi:MAG: hypothetical protein HRU32_14990 [Rhodobacteraceae bacterium]|nr:hypothetical protein [Paracoccaceae bacterium]
MNNGTRNFGRACGAVTLLASLAACGGSGSDDLGGGGPNTVFTYQTFDSTVPGDSNVRAVGLDRDSGGLVVSVDNLAGLLSRQNQSLRIAGLIVDNDGISGNQWSDGSTTVTQINSAPFTGQYDFFVPVTVNSGGFATPYLIGVVSRAQDLPSGGTASFTGQSLVTAILSGAGTGGSSFEAMGEVTLTANFAANTVSAVMSSLTGSGATFDSVEIGNMVIQNSGGDAVFASGAGTTFAASNGGGAVDPIGTVSDIQATGAFFGGDAQGPLEAGGTFNVVGADGQVFGVFAAEERN